MSLKVERKNLGTGFFTVKFNGHVTVYKVYKKNTDGTFVDIYGSTWEAKDSSIRVNVVDYDSLIVVYDKIDPTSTVVIEDYSKNYSHFYSCSFKAQDMKCGAVTIDPIIENPGNLNISASVAVSIMGVTEVFEFPISGEYVASSSETIGIPVADNSYTLKDTIQNQNFSIYIPENVKETENLTFNRSTIINKTTYPMNVFLELKIFSINGKMDISPIIKRIRVIQHDKF